MTAGDGARGSRARRFAANAAAIGGALVFAVIVASAYIRLSQAGPGWSGPAGLARIVHRLAASTETVLVILLAVVCWRARREWLRGALVTAAIAALTVFLAVLGIVTAEAQPPPVTLGNLLGGMVLFAMFGWLRLEASNAAPHAWPAPAGWAWGGVVLLALQIALGGLVSAHHAATSCATLPSCDGEWWPGGASSAIPAPAAAQDSVPGAAPLPDAARRAWHMAHRFGAGALLLYWIALTFALRSGARAAGTSAAVVTAMLLAQAVLGVTVVASGAAVMAAVVHNAWAALTVLAAVYCSFQSGSAAEAGSARQIVTSK